MQLQGGSGVALQQPTYTPQVAAGVPQTNMSGNTAVLGTNTTNNNPNQLAATGTAGAGMNQAEYLAGIQQQYNAAIQGGSNLIAQNQANLPINQGALAGYVGAQENQAQAQTDNQVNTYNTQKSGVQGQQTLSLAQLADSIRGQNQGLQAQLGAVGAGSSSAGSMGQYALAHEQNSSRANIQQQAGSNIANIDAQIQQTQANLHPYLQTLEAYKTQQTQSILQNYNTLQSQLEQQINQAQGEEKARLALYGQTIQDSAGAALTSLDQQVAGASQNFAAQQQATLANAPGQYQAPTLANPPAAIQSPQVSPFQISQPTGNATAAPTGGSLAALLQQQNATA